MKDRAAIRERFLRDGTATRLGGLAANLGRIRSFIDRGASDELIKGLVDESKHFIEWTAAELDTDAAAELVQIQVELAGWQLRWPATGDADGRELIAEEAGTWSERILTMSGLLV